MSELFGVDDHIVRPRGPCIDRALAARNGVELS
jgi:hypothetical protein